MQTTEFLFTTQGLALNLDNLLRIMSVQCDVHLDSNRILFIVIGKANEVRVLMLVIHLNAGERNKNIQTFLFYLLMVIMREQMVGQGTINL